MRKFSNSSIIASMNNIAILEKTKEYLVIKIPRRFFSEEVLDASLKEENALKILKAGMREYKEKKTKALNSLRDLRYGN